MLGDLQYALRGLRRSPGFTATAVLTLALGIGANTAMFSLIRAVLLPGLPFPEPDRLVALEMTNPRTGEVAPGLNWRDAADFRAQTGAFADFGMQRFALLNWAGGGRPEAFFGARVSAGLLRVLGVAPHLGRAFEDSEDLPGAPHVMLLSDWLWRGRFGADPSMVGKSISLSGGGPRDWLIVGVMPPGFNFPLNIHSDVTPGSRQMAFWIPLGVDVERAARGGFGGTVVARLRPGITVAEAQADADGVAARLRREYPPTNTDRGVRVAPLADTVFGRSRPMMLLLLAATGLVILIGCTNIAGLLLARGAARSRETAVRVALGAGRARLVRQWTTEALLIALLGGAAGLLLAAAGRGLVRALAPPELPGIEHVRIDGLVLAFTAGVATLAGLLFSLAPAWQSVRADPQAALAGGRGALGPRHGRTGRLLVAGEAALAVLLSISAGLLLKSFARLLALDPGYRPAHVLTAVISPFDERAYPDAAAKVSFYRRLLEELRATPGVEAAGAVIGVPLSGNFPPSEVRIAAAPAGSARPLAEVVPASADYFQAIGIPLLRGRRWTAEEVAAGRRVALVNDVAAARFWPGQDPVGKRLALDVQPGRPSIEVIGVVRGTREAAPDRPPSPAVYLPMEQGTPFVPQFLVVRTAETAAAFAPVLRRAVARLDKAQPVYVMMPMQSLLDRASAERRFATVTLGIFAALALLLAMAGIYGVVSYSVARRAPEIGVRLALGATRADVARLVLREGLGPALAGIPAGWCAALALTRLLAGLLYGVAATDPAVFAAVPALLLVAESAACLAPARRALRIDPAAALRLE